MKHPEMQLHRAVAQYLTMKEAACMGTQDEFLWWTCLQNPRSARHGALQKRLGVRPGVADIIIVRDGSILALELKAPEGNVSPAQIEFRHRLRRVGGWWVQASTLAQVEAQLRDFPWAGMERDRKERP